MVCVADAVTPSSSSRSSSDLEIGCLADLATGLVSFNANGKELPTSYQVSKYNSISWQRSEAQGLARKLQ